MKLTRALHNVVAFILFCENICYVNSYSQIYDNRDTKSNNMSGFPEFALSLVIE